MTNETRLKLSTLANGIDESLEESCTELKSFINQICDDENFDEQAGKYIIDSFDGLNDQVVPLLRKIYILHKGSEWYRCILFLFDENIDLVDCEELLVKAIISDMKCEEFDEILKDSSNQNEFKSVLMHYLESHHGIDNESIFYEKELSQDYIVHLKNENQELNEKNKELQKDLEVCYAHITDLSTEKDKAVSSKEELDKEINRLKKELNHSGSAYTLLEMKYSKNKEQLERLEKKTEQLSLEVRDASGPSPAEINVVKEENSSLKEEVDRLNSVIVELREELFGVKEELEKAKEQLAPPESDYTSPDNIINMNDSTSFNSREFTDSLFEDDRVEYPQEDIVPVKDNTSFIKKTSSFFANLLSRHFEKKFSKKPFEEQKQLIFVKLMENDYSKDISVLVRDTIDNSKTVSILELFRLISNNADENDIRIFCRDNAA